MDLVEVLLSTLKGCHSSAQGETLGTLESISHPVR